MNIKQQLRWGVIGLGIGEQHAAAIDGHEFMQLAAVCDISTDVLSSIGKRFKSATQFTDQYELIGSGSIDAVVIASFDDQHADAIVAALDAGLHVFCEKPLVTSRQQLVDVVNALNRNPHLHLMSNTLLRRSPRFVWLKNEIDSGGMGSVFHAEVAYLYGRLNKLLSGWRGDNPDYSVTLGGTIHLIDLILWLLGERPQSVMGIGGSEGTSRSGLHNPDRSLIQDFRMALMRFPSGTTAAVSANFACVHPHFHRVEVYGTSGTFMNVPPLGITAEDSAAYFFSSRDPEFLPKRLNLPYPSVPKSVLIPGFMRTIQGLEPEISEQSAVDAVTVALAVDEAVLSGASIEVSFPEVLPRRKPE